MLLPLVYPSVSQFEKTESTSECGFYAVALAKSLSYTMPLLTAEQVDMLADSLYVQYDGSNTPGNTNGMTLDTLHRCLDQVAISWQDITPGAIMDTIAAGKPVIIAVEESSVEDIDLQASPYGWNTSGLGHMFLVVGYDLDTLYCLDPANVGLNGIVRAWPRRYILSDLTFWSATAISMPGTSYTVVAGDNLSSIALRFHTTPEALYTRNQQMIEQAALAHGHTDSNHGSLIFPDTVLQV